MEEGLRTYVAAPEISDFGTIERTSFLGLTNAPVITLDDGRKVGLAGTDALKHVVPVNTGKNLMDETIEVPLDVRTVGIQVMTAMSYSAETQATMFENFVKLPKSQRDEYAGLWLTVKDKTPEEQKTFVEDMIAAL